MGMKIFSKHLFFFVTQCLAIFVSLVSESWVVMFIGVELSVISFIPLLSNIQVKKFSVSYFMMKIIGSILILFGKLKVSPLCFTLGVFIKLSGFPVFWLPLSLKVKMSNWVYFWLFTFQKIPLYMLFKEFFLLKLKVFYFASKISLMMGSIYMLSAKSFLDIISWNKVVHSMNNMLMLSFCDFNVFMFTYCIYSMSVLVGFWMLKWEVYKFQGLSLSKIYNLLFFFSLMGIPMFMNVMSEMMLFCCIPPVWSFGVIFSMVFQLGILFRLVFLVWKNSFSKKLKSKYFFFMVMLTGLVFIFFM